MQVIKKRFNRKGQFYFIAALAIVAVLMGFSEIANYIKTEKQTEIYRLKEEILVEKLAVLDYVIFSEETPEKIMETLVNFSTSYIISNPETNFYFLLGNTTSLTLLAYQTEASTIAFQKGENDIVPISLDEKTIFPQSFPGVNEEIGLILNYEQDLINPFTYEFKLKEGINIYFVISSEKNDQRYIAYS